MIETKHTLIIGDAKIEVTSTQLKELHKELDELFKVRVRTEYVPYNRPYFGVRNGDNELDFYRYNKNSLQSITSLAQGEQLSNIPPILKVA